MSWSRQAEGSAQEVLEKVRSWKKAQADVDRSYLAIAQAGVIAGHGIQIDAAIATVERVVEGMTHLLTEQVLSVTASGHANPDGTGQLSVTIHHVKSQ